MGVFDALNIAGSSLKTNQKAMDVISHNIANVNTPGYSRQKSLLVTHTPDKIGQLSFGRGVDLQSVNRLADPLIDLAQRENISQREFYTRLTSGLGVVENVFGSLQSTGFSSGLDEFFLAWQSMANNPQDDSQKFNVRSKSETLTNVLTNMDQQLRDGQRTADTEIDQLLIETNSLLTQIADLSAQIRRQESAFSGNVGEANDLRDKRDQATRDLAGIIPIQHVITNDETLLIQTLSGDLLVHGDSARVLVRSTTVGANGFKDVVISGRNVPISGLDKGGSIGGLIELRDNKLGSYMKTLDSIAANLVFSVNQVHASGVSSGRMSNFTAGQAVVNAGVAIDDAVQDNAFSSQIKTGQFTIHLYNATGQPIVPGGTNIAITKNTTTMTQIATALNNITGISASVDPSGQLIASADVAGNTFGFSDDTSNFLAVYEINTLFHGQTAGGLTINAVIKADATKINTGVIEKASSVIFPGDNTSAIAIMALQDAAISIDGTPSMSLHARTSALATNYGTDVAIAEQQRLYRVAETESLSSQRQAVSGVSIDEELIEMIKFQRAYEASAKVIQTTNTMLDSLMGILR